MAEAHARAGHYRLCDDQPVIFVRYEAAEPNGRGRRPGIFALANGLAHDGRLSDSDWTRWRSNNDWFQAAYTDPATVDPTLFDRSVNPEVRCWFKPTADHLLARVPSTLRLLDRYGIAWAERTSANPGRVLYEDEVQIVVAPCI